MAVTNIFLQALCVAICLSAVSASEESAQEFIEHVLRIPNPNKVLNSVLGRLERNRQHELSARRQQYDQDEDCDEPSEQIALRYGLVESEVPYYKYSPAPVIENGHATLYWDGSVITDRTIAGNKPDIVLTDRSMRQAMLVDITIPHDEILVKAEREKNPKYLDLAHEVTVIWDVDSTIIVPIVVSANGVIAKSLDQHKRLSLNGWIKGQIQNAVLLDTARIVRKFLSMSP